MTILQRIADNFNSRFSKGAAIAAAAAIGLTAMGDTAQARGQHGPQSGVTIQLAHGGHHGYAPSKTRCVAKAIRRNGGILRGTRGVGVKKRERRACRVAMRKCRDRLNHKRYKTGRAFPYARCEVTRVNRVAANNHHHHNHNNYGGWGGIVLKF